MYMHMNRFHLVQLNDDKTITWEEVVFSMGVKENVWKSQLPIVSHIQQFAVISFVGRGEAL